MLRKRTRSSHFSVRKRFVKLHVRCASLKEKIYDPLYFVTCNSCLDMLTVRLLPQVLHDSNGFVFQQDVEPCDFHIAVQNYLDTHHPWSWIVLAWAGDFVSCRWPSKSTAFNSARHLVELLIYESQVSGSASAVILAGAEVANYRLMASLCTVWN